MALTIEHFLSPNDKYIVYLIGFNGSRLLGNGFWTLSDAESYGTRALADSAEWSHFEIVNRYLNEQPIERAKQ
jgi:hypothetical protein